RALVDSDDAAAVAAREFERYGGRGRGDIEDRVLGPRLERETRNERQRGSWPRLNRLRVAVIGGGERREELLCGAIALREVGNRDACECDPILRAKCEGPPFVSRGRAEHDSAGGPPSSHSLPPRGNWLQPRQQFSFVFPASRASAPIRFATNCHQLHPRAP